MNPHCSIILASIALVVLLTMSAGAGARDAGSDAGDRKRSCRERVLMSV